MSTVTARLNTILLTLVLLTGLAILATLALRAEGGPLDPPAAPASTDSVRLPGTPISSLPFAISTPGYYYVTRDLTGAAGQNGITISTSNVTVDLGGFRLLGGPNPGEGITSGGLRNITIRNGSVRGWNNGINLSAASMSRVEGVQASSNTAAGFQIGLRSWLSNCNASLNAVGIFVNYGRVSDCIISENTAQGVNLGDFALVERNSVQGNGGFVALIAGSNNTVRDNDFMSNTSTNGDVRLAGSTNVVIANVYCSVQDLTGTSMFMNNVGRPGC